MPAAFWWGLLALPLGALGVAVLVGAFWLLCAFVDDRLVVINASDKQRKKGRTYSSRIPTAASIFASRRAYLWRLLGVRIYFVFGRVPKARFQAAERALYTVPIDIDGEDD